jgi:hypothetical protein
MEFAMWLVWAEPYFFLSSSNAAVYASTPGFGGSRWVKTPAVQSTWSVPAGSQFWKLGTSYFLFAERYLLHAQEPVLPIGTNIGRAYCISFTEIFHPCDNDAFTRF